LKHGGFLIDLHRFSEPQFLQDLSKLDRKTVRRGNWDGDGEVQPNLEVRARTELWKDPRPVSTVRWPRRVPPLHGGGAS
jgi:hypothetical protein